MVICKITICLNVLWFSFLLAALFAQFMHQFKTQKGGNYYHGSFMAVAYMALLALVTFQNITPLKFSPVSFAKF
jgi:hypothetical protein